MFKYETHLHTAETSKCARSPGAEMARHFSERGYTGIFVTDHFFNGNTTVPPELPWEERVTLFARGFEAAAEEGARCGLDVFFAWEYSLGWAHFLTYGLDTAWLLAHPDMMSWDMPRYIAEVHEAGGYLIHAHPWRITDNPVMRMVPDGVDAIEAINASQPDETNRHAADYAASYHLPVTAGSDIHNITAPRRAGVLTARRLTDGADYAHAVICGETQIFLETPIL